MLTGFFSHFLFVLNDMSDALNLVDANIAVIYHVLLSLCALVIKVGILFVHPLSFVEFALFCNLFIILTSFR